MPDRELLEEFQLYRKKEIELSTNRGAWPKPAIRARCVQCGSLQTFNMLNEYQQYDREITPFVASSSGEKPSSVLRLVYVCAGCQKSRRYFMVLVVQAPRMPSSGLVAPERVTTAQVIKVGQFPAYDIAPDPALSKKLGEKTGLYKKGLVCESQGYGIGAFAYYRRIVEDTIESLLEEIEQLVPAPDLDQYQAALAAARASHVASDKIKIVKELLPSTLRPGGANPLALLHSALSEGIHDLTDEECLERASSIREVLVFLTHQIAETATSGRKFGDSLKKILGHKRDT